MTFGQILDRIFRLMRSHWKTFTAIGMLPMLVLFAFYALFFGALFFAGVFAHLPAQPNVAGIHWVVIPASLLFIPIMFLMYGLYYGASSYATLKADHGFKITAGEAYRHAWSRIGRYAWLMVLRGLIIAIPILVLAIAVAVGALLLGLFTKGATPSPAALVLLVPLVVLLYLGAIVYAILMSLRLSLAFCACVHEDITAFQAIKRSGVLTQGAKGRIFLVLLIIYAISYAAIMVMYVVGIFVVAIGALVGVGHLHAMSPLTIALAALAGIVVMVLVLVWTALLLAAYSTAFAVFYRDQCLRRDGPPLVAVQASEPA
jgi:hypothetical protein